MSYWQEHGRKFDIHGMTLDEKVKQLCSVRAHNVNVVLKLVEVDGEDGEATMDGKWEALG